MLAAICIGVHFNVNDKDISEALEQYTPSNNRSQLEKTSHNTVILDAYNANPTSVRSALDNFSEIESNDKLFVLGHMLELGKNSKLDHHEISDVGKKLDLQGGFVGKIVSSIGEANEFLSLEGNEPAEGFFSTALAKSTLIFLQGSRGSGLERLVEIL